MATVAPETVFDVWKRSLARLLAFYEEKRATTRRFFPKLFLFFLAINLFCYWWGLFTAFPELTRGWPGKHYFRVQFPVGFLGALFDSLSFFVTVWIVRRALQTTSRRSYLGHLSIDIVIAIVATWWVLFVFSVSGWIISVWEAQPQMLVERHALYERRVSNALENPAQNLKSIYFGIIMGVSAMIPTSVHLYLSLRAFLKVRFGRARDAEPEAA